MVVRRKDPDVSRATRKNPASPKPAHVATPINRAHNKTGRTPAAGTRKTANPIEHYGQTAKKPEKDDRPLKHGPVQKKHKKRQILEQQKI